MEEDEETYILAFFHGMIMAPFIVAPMIVWGLVDYFWRWKKEIERGF